MSRKWNMLAMCVQIYVNDSQTTLYDKQYAVPVPLLVRGRSRISSYGGGSLKNIAPSGGRREIFWGISCEKSLFYVKKSYFFQLRREARKLLGYFVWKITILRPKILFFPILGGGGAPLDPPLLVAPEHIHSHLWHRYSLVVNEVMMPIVKISKWWLQLDH